MKKIIAALFLALIALAPISAARADGNPTTILAGCGMAVNGTAGASLYSYGTLSTYLTVSTVTGGTASHSCGSAVARSNGGAAMADPTPAPASGLIYYAINADPSGTLTLTAPSGVIKAGSASSASLALAPGQTALIASDGVNQYVIGGNYGASGGGSSGVTSFNGRTGPVTSASGDYSIAQITGSGTGIVISSGGALSVATTLPGNYTFSGSLAFSNPIALGSSTAATQTAGDSSTKVATDAFVAAAVASASTGAVLRDHIAGLTISNDGTSPNTVIDISAGQATNSTAAHYISLSAITKTTGAFATGAGNGGLDTGTVAASTWYHLFAISNAAGTTSDALISKSATAPTMPSGFTLFRRLGSILTNSSSQITPFVQDGQTFYWGTQVADITASSVATASRALYTLSVPSGVKVRPMGRLSAMNGTKVDYIVTSPDETDVAPPSPVTQGVPGADMTEFNTQTVFSTTNILNTYTNTSAQIGIRADPGSSPTVIYFITRGWIDDRGIYN